MIEFIQCPSPNHDARADGRLIDMLVLHYTGMETGEAALARLCDPAAMVSAHYLVEEDGRVFALVPETQRAWHAGVSFWRGHRDINARSIGIEIVNPGHEFGYRDFPATQIDALTHLARHIVERHAIPARNVVGHSDVAPARKTDPGERFPWEAIARAGIGLWPDGIDACPGTAFELGQSDAKILSAQRLLGRYGYETPETGMLDETTAQILTAFQRHFRPACIDGRLDAETLERIRAVVAVAEGDGAQPK
jgi:N-acetylmuramoyl-L-alanine amidase